MTPVRELTIINRRAELADPHLTTDDRDLLGIRYAVFEPLVRLSSVGEPLPLLAVDWNCKADARSWTLQLRRDVTFHDGSPFGALDVIASLRRVNEQELGGEMASGGVYRSYLGGAQFEAQGDDTVRIVTAEPCADLMDILATLVIVPHGAAQAETSPTIGTGPYRVATVTDREVTLAAYPKYWGTTPPADIVHWQSEERERRRVDALLSGSADLIGGIGFEARETIRSAAGLRVVEAETSVCVAFMCNLKNGSCSDRRVRQALNYGLNIDEIIDDVTHGGGHPLNGPVTPRHFGFDDGVAPYPCDPIRAVALLRDAGFSDGIELVFDVPESLPDEAPALARRMAEHYARLGITATIRTFADRPGYAEMVRAKQIDDACCFDSSPQSTYRVLREKLHGNVQGPWWQGYSNPVVNTLIDQAAATPETNRRRALYREALRLIRDDAPWIFLYSPRTYLGVGPRLTDWQPGVNGIIEFV